MTDRLIVTPAARVDFADTFGTSASGGVNAAYEITPNWTVKGGIAKAFKAPNLYQLSDSYIYTTSGRGCPYPYYGNGPCYVLGNSELDPETSINSEIGVSYNNAYGVNATLTYFHNDYNDRIQAGTQQIGMVPVLDRGGNAAEGRLYQWMNVEESEVEGLEGNFAAPLGDQARLVIAKDVAAATDGRVELLVMPSGQLGNEARMLQKLKTGAIDFAMLTGAEFANRDPDFGIFYAPYLVEGIEGAGRLLEGEVAQTLLDRMSDFGLHGLTWGAAGMRQVVTRGEVATVEDLNGARIRTVPLAPEMDFWTEVGAVPTPMPLPALYDAFANGQVDAMQVDHEGTWNSGYWRHAGTILDSRHMMFPMAAVATGRKWQAMPEDDRATVARIFDERVAEMVDLYGEIDAANLERLRETDVPVVTVGRDWFGPAVDAWYDAWREKAPLLSELEAEAAQ